MMLKKTGQDPQALKIRKDGQADGRPRQSQDADYESLGDEEEISLNFENYSDGTEAGDNRSQAQKKDGDGDEEAPAHDVGEPRVYRSKDAGKTCKERFSYSSFDAGATILKAGGGAKNAKAILVENKDSYMLMECATPNKYVIVELSDDIQVDTVVLANFEFFSSMIRHFRVSVSDRYPVKMEKWKELGTFEARNSREIQAFLVENPQIWAKYIRIEFLTHYSNEYYCPLSLLRIHGSRMLDSWKDSETIDEIEDSPHDAEWVNVAPTGTIGGEEPPHITEEKQEEPPMCTFPGNPFFYWNGTCGLVCYEMPAGAMPQIGTRFIDANDSSPSETQSASSTSAGTFMSKPTRTTESHSTTISTATSTQQPPQQQQPSPQPPPQQQRQQQQQQQQQQQSHSSETHPPTPVSQTVASVASPSSSPSSSGSDTTSQAAPKSQGGSQPGHSSASSNKTATSTSVSKNRSSGTSSASASSPTVQEGFFNAITKRLQQVETNLTLSLKYMEEQSKHVQDAFQRAEQKQITKISSLLDHLNGTVLAELRTVRDQYDQIWQSTVLALESQRDQSDRDILALSSRLNLLADEVIFQKRMAIVQAVLLLSCLLLVIFSRGVPIPYIGAPQEQGAMATAFAEILASIQKDVYGPDSPPGQRRRSKPPLPSIPQSPPSTASSPNGILTDQSPNEPAASPPAYGYQRPSPPLTPTREAEPAHSDDWSASNPNSTLHPTNCEPSSIRKPLPSLPEDPASPDRV